MTAAMTRPDIWHRFREVVSSGETPADRLLRLYDTSWGGELQQIFNAEQYQ